MAAHDPAAAVEQPHSPFATTRIPASTASSCAPRLLEAALIYMSVFIMDKTRGFSVVFRPITEYGEIGDRIMPDEGIEREVIPDKV